MNGHSSKGMPARIRTDDQVVVISGKDRGKRGRVLRVEPKKNRVYVEGLNIIKRHQRPRHHRNRNRPAANRGGARRSRRHCSGPPLD